MKMWICSVSVLFIASAESCTPRVWTIFNKAFRDWSVVLLLGLVSYLAGWQGGLAELLCYDRHALLEGQGWRVVTGHLVHGSFLHWGMNLLGLVLIVGLFERRESAGRLWLILLLLSCIVSAGLFLFNPDLQRYVGLSGVLHGLFAWYALRDLRAGSRWGLVVLLLLIAKLCYEQISGPSVDTEALVGLPIIIDAHLYGLVGGMLLALWQPDEVVLQEHA